MDEKIIKIPESVTIDIFKSAAQNFYNNGYIDGCVAGIKQGKKCGESSGWVKGFIVGGLFAAGGLGLYLLSKKVVNEVDDLFEDCNWREVKTKEEKVDGSEPVQGE